MSREAYQIPTSQTNNAPGAAANTTVARTFDTEGAMMNYLCGDCGYKFALGRRDAIRCKECGCRILYKERTKRMVQFEAR
ncbi:DNA directed RNA polymerase [Xylaria sp. CBS 124048]|nr:DNA directed RNA polymerase [Xylaria sp. CBS 124048]